MNTGTVIGLVIGAILGGLALYVLLSSDGYNDVLAVIIAAIAIAVAVWTGSMLFGHSRKEKMK